MNTIKTKTLEQLINYVSDTTKDLTGSERHFVVDNLRTVKRQKDEAYRLLEMVLEDVEDGDLSWYTVKRIKEKLQ